MAHNRNVVKLRIAYRNFNKRSAVQCEIRFLNELNQLLMLNQRLHNHGLEPVVPTITEQSSGDYGCVIQLKFPIEPKGDTQGQYNYGALHALLLQLSQLYTQYKQAFTRMEFNLDVSGVKTPWVIRSGDHSALVNPNASTLVYRGKEVPINLAEEDATVIEMLIIGEPKVVAKFNRSWRRDLTLYPIGKARLYVDRIPTNKAQIFVLIQESNGDTRVVPLDHPNNVFGSKVSAAYVEQFGGRMVNGPLLFTNTHYPVNGLPTNILFPDLSLITIET